MTNPARVSTDEVAPPTRARPESGQSRLSGWRRLLPVLVPLAFFVLLVIGGVTNSSIGAGALREDPAHSHGLQIGSAQLVRSDEYLTESPIWLGQIAIGPGSAVNPLSVSPDFFAQLPSGPVSAIVFFDGSLLRLGPWLPDAMLFAFKWWLPTLLLAVGMPVWFRQVVGSWRWGYLATFLTIVAPASMWWSGRPINTLGFMFAGCALGIRGVDELSRRNYVRFIGCTLAAGVLLARLPTYYQPLAIVLGIPVALATAAFLLARRGRTRDKVIGLTALALSAAVFTALLILEDLPAIKAGLETSFPGSRRSTGMPIGVGRIFGATDLGFLKQLQGNMNGSNPSEVSTSFAVLLLVVILLIAIRPWRRERGATAAILTMLGCAAFWLTWCTISWGALGLGIPLANLVPFFRAANGLGFLAVIVFCMFMTGWTRPPRLVEPLAAAGLTAFVSAWAGSSLQQEVMPLLSTKMIWASSLAAAAVVFVLTWRPDSRWPLAVAGLTAALMTYSVTPILVGLGDLRGTNASQMFLDRAAGDRRSTTLWASDSRFVDSLMLATGTPALSSRQQIGPNVSEWDRLDPGGDHEAIWNRGGSYITFDWTASADVTFSNPNPDVILISTSPCAVARRIPELRFVVSTKPLTDGCLTKVDTFQWSGLTQTVYSVT